MGAALAARRPGFVYAAKKRGFWRLPRRLRRTRRPPKKRGFWRLRMGGRPLQRICDLRAGGRHYALANARILPMGADK